MASEIDGCTFLTSHARVLLAIARDPAVPLRQVAATCRISERTAQAIVTDLEEAGYLNRRRVGRCDQYTLHLDGKLRHPAESGISVRALVEIFASRKAGASPLPG